MGRAGECPRQDSNLRTRLRRPMLYPLSYEGGGWRITGRRPGGRGVFLVPSDSRIVGAPPCTRSCPFGVRGACVGGDALTSTASPRRVRFLYLVGSPARVRGAPPTSCPSRREVLRGRKRRDPRTETRATRHHR